MQTQMIAIKIPAELKQELHDRCEREALNASEVIRRLIDLWVREQVALPQKRVG